MTYPTTFNPTGKSSQQLSNEYGVSLRTIQRWMSKWKQQQSKENDTSEDVKESEVKYKHVVTEQYVNIVRVENDNVDTRVIVSTDPQYNDVVQDIKLGKPLEKYFVRSQLRQLAIKTNNSVVIDETGVYYKDHRITGLMADCIAKLYLDGRLEDNIVQFLDRLVQNPDNRVLKQLYPFMIHNDITISKDGCLLAFKKVRYDYYDIHSNSIRNMPGDIVEMPRNMVDSDPDETCSHGLHVCAKYYLRHYGSPYSSLQSADIIVSVKVDPKDVVSVPRDYNGAKMRVCKYEVLAEVYAE